MTFLAAHPGTNTTPAGCDAFDTERAALAWAQRITARGIPHCVVYEIADAALEPIWRAARSDVDPSATDVALGRNGTIQSRETT